MKPRSRVSKLSIIPKAGRIGRFARIIEKEVGRDIVKEVMRGADRYETSNYAEKAAWWREAVGRLVKEVGEETAIKIMESCGRKCCGPTRIKHAKKLMSESESLEELLGRLNKIRIGGGRLRLNNQNIIVGGYDHCYCGQVKQTKEPFSNRIYCHCSVGWYKQLFESALGRPVQIEIQQSIISGAESCEFIIHI